MGQILRHWRVPAAAAFSLALIAGAYMLARSIEAPPSARASEESALLKAIAAKDSDNDGLPDWEEALYGTDPHNSDSFKLGMTDGAAVAKGLIVPKAIADIPAAASSPVSLDENGLPPPPAEGTLTSAFAKNFFALYLVAKQNNGGADLSQTDLQAIANQALTSLSSAIVAAPDFKSAKDLTVSGSGADDLTAFAVSAEAVLLKNTSNATTSEIKYLTYAVEGNDANALMHIASIAKAYRDSAAGLAVLPMPKEASAAGLALINATMRVSEIASDFARVNDDPLAAILALQQYPKAVLALGTAFVDIGKIYKAAGVVLPVGAPGASFVNLITDVANEQAAAKKP